MVERGAKRTGIRLTAAALLAIGCAGGEDAPTGTTTAADCPPVGDEDLARSIRLQREAADSYNLKESADAIAKLEEALGINPCEVSLLNDLGIAYHQNHQIKLAIDTLQRAIALDPLYPAAHLNLGAVYDDFANYEAAAASYEEFIRLRGDFADAHSRLGVVFLKTNQPDKAMTSLQRAVELEPKNPELWYHLGGLAFMKNEMEQAEEYLGKALEINPLYGDAHYKLGQTLQRLGRDEEAQQHFDDFKAFAGYQEQIDGINRMLRQGGSDRADYLFAMLGDIYSRMGRHEEALANYARASEARPENHFAMTGQAAALRALGRLDEAMEAARRAVELSPDDYLNSYDMLVAILVAKHEHDEALQVLEKQLELDPNHSYAVLNRSTLLVSAGRYQEAIAGLEAFVADNPEHIGAHEHLLAIYASADDESYRDAERALAEARIAEKLGSRRFDLIAEAYHMKGDLTRASEWLRRAISEADASKVDSLQRHLDEIEAERRTQ